MPPKAGYNPGINRSIAGYVNSNNEWVPAGTTGGSSNVYIKGTDEVNMSAAQDNDRFSIATSTTPVKTWDISWADEVQVAIDRTGSTDTIAVNVSYDGDNFETFEAVVARDNADGTYTNLGAVSDGIYTIPFNGKKLSFTASGSTDSFTIGWSARNSGRAAV